jgi:RNA polymerase sigma factor (sigma-70 family)
MTRPVMRRLATCAGNIRTAGGVLEVLTPRRLHRLDDQRLAALVRAGDGAAFEALYDRHHASLLAFCRHMLSSREDGEDALQQTFLRAHAALRKGRPPQAVRPWLFAIARNRCRTLLAARLNSPAPADELEPAFDGLAEDVHRRAELRQLVTDLARLPEDQRGALVLYELGDLSHPEISSVLGCAPDKVKALVFQARSTLIADRDARDTPCASIREQLEVARAGALRRGALRRHLRQCEPCTAYRALVARQRAGLASILPVAPSIGLKAAILAGAGSSGTGGAAAAASLGAAGAVAPVGGAGVKAIAAKIALAAVVAGGGTSGGVMALDAVDQRGAPVRAAVEQREAVRVAAEAGGPGEPAAATFGGPGSPDAADVASGGLGTDGTAAGGQGDPAIVTADDPNAGGPPLGQGQRGAGESGARRRALLRARRRGLATRRAILRARRRGLTSRRAILRLRRDRLARRRTIVRARRHRLARRRSVRPPPPLIVTQRRAERRGAAPILGPRIERRARIERPRPGAAGPRIGRQRRPPPVLAPTPTPTATPTPTPTPTSTPTPTPPATPTPTATADP